MTFFLHFTIYDLTTDPITRSSYYSFFGNYEAEQPLVTNYIAGVTTGGTSLTAADKALNVANAPAGADVINPVILTVNDSMIQNRLDSYTCRIGSTLSNVAVTAAGSSSKVYGFLIPSIIGSFSKKLFPVS